MNYLTPATDHERKIFYEEEYNHKEIPDYITNSIADREFAFDSYGKGPRDRYNVFHDTKNLGRILYYKKPFAVYSSVALYQRPQKREGWKGAELVFDVDAKDIPIRTCDCGDGEICPFCLSQAKEIMLGIYDVLCDLGLKDIHMVYSGRGYHLRCLDEEVLVADMKVRREILNYCLGAVSPEFGKDALLQHFAVNFAYPRTFTDWLMYTVANMEEERKYAGLNTRDKKQLMNIKEHILRQEWAQARNNVKPKKYDTLIKQIAKINSTLTDTKVTIDVQRILRLPSTLHTKVSMKCVDIKNIETFNPLRDALPKYVEERK